MGTATQPNQPLRFSRNSPDSHTFPFPLPPPTIPPAGSETLSTPHLTFPPAPELAEGQGDFLLPLSQGNLGEKQHGAGNQCHFSPGAVQGPPMPCGCAGSLGLCRHAQPSHPPHHGAGEAAASSPFLEPPLNSCANPTSETIPVSAAQPALGPDISGLLSILTEGKNIRSILTKRQLQEESEDVPEMQSFHHFVLKAAHHLPSHDIAPATKKKSWKEAWGWLCLEAAAISCGSNASHPAARTFKEPLACTQAHKTQLMNVLHPTVCVLTQPCLPRRKKKKRKHACVYVWIYKGFKEDVACSFTALLKGFVLFCFLNISLKQI